MERTNRTIEYGVLPDHGLLGIAYVPEQKSDSPRYDKENALKNGTLFPGLNLPYGKYVPSAEVAETPKGQLMALSFVLDELALYLDTRPGDKEALALRNSYAKLYKEAMAAYTKEHGPMDKNMVMDDKYSWVDNPWPWD